MLNYVFWTANLFFLPFLRSRFYHNTLMQSSKGRCHVNISLPLLTFCWFDIFRVDFHWFLTSCSEFLDWFYFQPLKTKFHPKWQLSFQSICRNKILNAFSLRREIDNRGYVTSQGRVNGTFFSETKTLWLKKANVWATLE